jgi:hypothetical protein
MKTVSKIIGIGITLAIFWHTDGLFEIYKTKLILGLIFLLFGYTRYGDNFLKTDENY